MAYLGANKYFGGYTLSCGVRNLYRPRCRLHGRKFIARKVKRFYFFINISSTLNSRPNYVGYS